MQKTTASGKMPFYGHLLTDFIIHPRTRFLMRVSFCVLSVIFLSSQLLLAKPGHGQDMEDKMITVELKDETLSNALDKVEKLSGFRINYNPKTVESYKGITLSRDKRTVGVTLRLILQNTGFAFDQDGTTILIYQKPTGKPDPRYIDLDNIPYADTTLRGRIVDDQGNALVGAVVSAKSSGHVLTMTNSNGEFELRNASDKEVYLFGMVSMQMMEMKLRPGRNNLIVMKPLVRDLGQVTVQVNTGYQTLPKERATGSFEVIDNKLFNRTVSSNVLDHIDGVVAGVVFDNRENNSSSSSQSLPRPYRPSFSIRGLSTINAEALPLIVVDNFPYKGDINNLNPNDVESVTILKDAAAASIWGAQAGNGVVIIVTKKGKYNSKPVVDFNTNVTVGTKPDYFHIRQLSTPDYIDLEKSLFAQGKYDGYIQDPANNQYAPLSPVVNLLYAVKNGQVSQADADAQIAAWSKLDVRHDLLKYFNKPLVYQQYSLNIRGGSSTDKYYMSAGYDKDVNSNSSQSNRYSINAGNTYMPFKNLELTLPIYFAHTDSRSNLAFFNNDQIYPYAQLADSHGNPLDVAWSQGKNAAFNAMAVSQGLYSYHFSPLSEFRLNQDDNYIEQEVRISPDIKYNFSNGLSLEALYQYDDFTRSTRKDQSDSSFQVRNEINSFTQVNPDGSLSFPINRGHFLTVSDNKETDQFLRLQVSYNHTIAKDHRIDFVGGYERSEQKIEISANGWYGYNPNTGQLQTLVDYVTQFQLYGQPYTGTLYPLNQSDYRQFYALRSKFGNLAYTYKGRYILSGSARTDQANLFGASTNNHNQKALWSAGGSWIMDRESFYHVGWLPSLKLRATYGFQGNIPINTYNVGVGQVTSLSPLATINYNSYPNSAGLSYATLGSVSNPNLRWEKVAQVNLGLDFATVKNRISGTLEYYHKKGSDLIASYLIDPTLGAGTNVGNIANIATDGIDVTINTRNIDRRFKWETRWIFSYNKDKVTKYLVPPTVSSLLSLSSASYAYTVSPIQGKAIYGVYSLRSAGLDPTTGDPQGYDAQGKVSKNWSDLVYNTPLANLVYSGSANPTVFGSVMNSFRYGGLSLSVNILYQAGFYFHQQSVNYDYLYGGDMLGPLSSGADYAKRWQKPGDEKTTYVPSAPLSNNNDYTRASFYQATNTLVRRGDHVRLKDINLSYDLNEAAAKKCHFSSLQIYSYTTLNIILWRANKEGIDPQYPTLNPQKLFSLGVRASF